MTEARFLSSGRTRPQATVSFANKISCLIRKTWELSNFSQRGIPCLIVLFEGWGHPLRAKSGWNQIVHLMRGAAHRVGGRTSKRPADSQGLAGRIVLFEALVIRENLLKLCYLVRIRPQQTRRYFPCWLVSSRVPAVCI